MKYLIVGLGNIGAEYDQTRHNIGFEVVDKLVQSKAQTFESGRLAQVAKVKIKGRIAVVLKPTTYMNLSGKAVQYWLTKEDIAIENVLVICDDLALPFGAIRIRAKGGAGGHNGLTNIIESIHTDQFSRLRFGVGSEFSKGKQVDYVLGKWGTEELKTLTERIELAVKAIESFVFIGAGQTMTNFNNK